MTTARDIMTPGADCVRTDETVLTGVQRMADLGVGALPIRGADDDRLEGHAHRPRPGDPRARSWTRPPPTAAGELAQEEAVTIGADDDAEEAVATMTHHRVRRLPVIDENRLEGVVAQADIARALPAPAVGDLIKALSAD